MIIRIADGLALGECPDHRFGVTRVAAALLTGLLVASCGAAQAPDDGSTTSGAASPPVAAGPGRWLRGTTPAPPQSLEGTTWRFTHAECTEGILDLAVRGYRETLRVHVDGDGTSAILTSEREYADTGCAETVVMRARRGNPADAAHRYAWQLQAQVQWPLGAVCSGAPQPAAPGDLRRRGEALEVFVQRSPRCGGYEARLVYEPLGTRADGGAEPEPRDEAALVRAFLVHFDRRDAAQLAALYSPSGRHLDPHRPAEDGAASHHPGSSAVRDYFAALFHHVPWVAVRLTDLHVVEANDAEGTPGEGRARLEYMDPRLDAPRPGELHLVTGGGVIVESRLELSAPRVAPSGGE